MFAPLLFSSVSRGVTAPLEEEYFRPAASRCSREEMSAPLYWRAAETAVMAAARVVRMERRMVDVLRWVVTSGYYLGCR